MNTYDKFEQLKELLNLNNFFQEEITKSPAKGILEMLVENNNKMISELKTDVEKFTMKPFCKSDEHKPGKNNNCVICGRALKQVWIEI